MKKIKLGDVLDVRRGASLAGEYYSEQGNLIRLTLGNFNYPRGGFQDNTSKKNIYFVGSVNPAFILKAGDIITPLTEQVSGLLGETATIPESDKYVQSGDIGLVIPDETKIDKRFAYYLVSSPVVRKQLDAAAQQTKIRHTSPDAIKACEAWIPENISTQRSIGKLLDALDEKIALNKKINATLEAIAKTLYDYWFVQFDFPDENGKPYKTSGGKMIYSSELGCDIPADWEVKKLADMANIFDSRRIPLSNSERASMKGDIPYYGATGIVDYVNKSIFDGVYLLVAEDGSVETNSGNLVLQYIWGKSWVNNHAHILQGIENCSTEYLYLALQKIKTKQLMTGSIQKKITQDKLLGTKLICPIDKSILRMFQKIISPVFTEYKLRTDASRRLAELRDWLLPMLMNGQIKFQGDVIQWTERFS